MEQKLILIRKMIISIGLVFLTCLNLKSQIIDQWEIVSDRIGTSAILDSLRIGYIGPDRFDTNRYTNKYGLILSTDGGKTWFNTYITQPVDTYQLEFRNWLFFPPSTIFILADSTVQIGYNGLNAIFNYMAIILKSTDLGKSWERIQINNKWRTRQSIMLSMSDSLRGVFIQLPTQDEPTETTDQIYYTDDGWKTWRKINAHPEQIACQKINFEFPNKIVAYAWGYENIYITSDLGQTWIKKHISIPDSGYYPDKNAFKILNNSTFFYIVYKLISEEEGYHTILFKTTDAGDTWIKLKEEKGFDNFSTTRIDIINDSTIYTVGPIPMFTSDNGKTWVRKYNAYFDNQQQIIFDRHHINKNRILARVISRLIEFRGNYTLLPPTIIEPKIVFNVPLDFTIKWTPIEGANEYELQCVEQEGFELDEPHKAPPAPNFDSVLFVHKIFDKSVNTYTFENTSYYKTYTCRMRAIGDQYISPWLAKYFVTMKENTSSANERQIKNGKIGLLQKDGTLIIHFNDGNVPQKITILDLLSKPMLSVQANNEITNIDISSYSRGIYFALFEYSDGSIVVEKFFKVD